MTDGKQNFDLARHEMIERQLRPRGIADERVIAAMAAIPRELFVPQECARHAYGDCPLPIGFGQTISQPYVVALMVQALAVEQTSRVLDVGAGSGYQAAILSRLAGHVFAIERIEQLTERAMTALAAIGADNVTLATGDGSLGWPQEAPFDRIICGAAAPAAPAAWLAQIKDGGRIVMPIGPEDNQVLTAIIRKGDSVATRALCDVRFVKLIGRQGWAEKD
jgi:protein-L-isoaspartate(D-aspartate) O-methyltransferase